MPEPWLRGPLPDVPFWLMPTAHALALAAEDIPRAVAGLTGDQLWTMPGGGASVGFHLRHVAGSLDRLLTYARDEALSDEQLRFLRDEADPAADPAELPSLLALALAAIETAQQTLRATPPDDLDAPRFVGRDRLPTTLFGLLSHLGDHTQRHAGQIVTTARVVRRSSEMSEGSA